MTNADKIRNMTNTELAKFIYEITDMCSREMACNQTCYCYGDSCVGYCEYENCLNWLESECDVE